MSGVELYKDLEKLQPKNDSAKVAFECLKELGMPTKKTEQYRYFDIESLLKKEWQFAPKERVQIKEAEFLEIVDGVVTKAPKEIEICYKSKSMIQKGHFDPLYYLGHLLNDEVISIKITKDTNLKIVHRYKLPKSLISYRLDIETVPNIALQLSESFDGCDACESFVLSGYDLKIARDARVEIIKDETLIEGTYTPIYSNLIDLDQQACGKLFTFDFGNADGLELLQVKLASESEFYADHLLYAKGEGKRGTVSQIIHSGKNAKSDQKAKNILQDRARGIFDALIKIDQTGAGAKAYQNSKAVLLNDGAYMASKPQLEIYIDDVEASHGSTIGELDEDQLFYIRSRGIALQEARKILILAFANEIIDAIEDESVRESVHLSFERVYYGQSQLECIATCHGCSDTIIGEE
ncbi:Iron-sulfur cluster assembly protein SufD [hydrothermal vent metagenome]|uniref:Iron-sulfur cluster assembly protein SufD n=1 Tax=hydrothermal vent metagenome TaxID=652676 RepID=A0A1W1BS53_9ZZZZ